MFIQTLARTLDTTVLRVETNPSDLMWISDHKVEDFVDLQDVVLAEMKKEGFDICEQLVGFFKLPHRESKTVGFFIRLLDKFLGNIHYETSGGMILERLYLKMKTNRRYVHDLWFRSNKDQREWKVDTLSASHDLWLEEECKKTEVYKRLKRR